MIYWPGMFYVQKRSQQPPEGSETLSSHQQPPTSSVATPSTTLPQPTSPAQARQQTRIGKLS